MKRNIFLKFFGLCATLCVVLAFATQANAQATTGSITGEVTDSTGAMIPNAVVTATNIDKGTEFRGQTNGAGEYIILNLTPGMYKVSASASGFETAIALNANVEIDQKQLLNFHLKAG